MTVVFLLGLSPKDYLHNTFFNHKDAIHPQFKKGEIVFYNKHFHCAFLAFEYDHFINSIRISGVFGTVVQFSDYVNAFYEFHLYATYKFQSLRGPPVFS